MSIFFITAKAHRSPAPITEAKSASLTDAITTLVYQAGAVPVPYTAPAEPFTASATSTVTGGLSYTTNVQTLTAPSESLTASVTTAITGIGQYNNTLQTKTAPAEPYTASLTTAISSLSYA